MRELPCLERVPKQKAFRTVPRSLWKIGTLPISRHDDSSDNVWMLGASCDLLIKSWVRKEKEIPPVWTIENRLEHVEPAVVSWRFGNGEEHREELRDSVSGGAGIIIPSDLKALHFGL